MLQIARRDLAAHQGHGRRFLKHAGWLAGLFVMADDAAWWILGIRGDAAKLQRQGITAAQMAGDMGQEDRMAAGYFIQVPSIRVTIFLQQGIVITASDHPGTFRLTCSLQPKGFDDIRDGVHGANGRAVEINEFNAIAP